ncbi:hypothetical protein [Sphingobacterium sp. BIGb0165]|uniref:hypothetical protein n=1 Tax=Sphingobacterium sp. BIGb0165 TaxID=2940615 RepID=UPI002169712A|nr:hypothetical protein [Sphingobacterium sp. BIGb0165]MCS4225090.1 FtsZ-binding cell division protein ZapB [Sphingobacterium sp. BIGb0165]
MSKLRLAFVFFTILFISSYTLLQAQTPTAAPVTATQQANDAYKYSPDGLRKGSLANQFDHLNYISKNNYDFKMVRKTNLDIVKKNVVDTVAKLRKEINTLKSSSSNYTSNTKNLQDSIQLLKDQLAQEQQKTDSFSFLGINTSKGLYSTVVWTIIGVLAVATFIFLFSYRKAKVDTVEFQKTAEQSQEEFATFRKKAMEKEQLLKRQLQDELNKKI